MTDLLAADATLEKLATGATWAEGPVYLPRTDAVRWSDVRSDRILQIDLGTGEAGVYAEGVEYTNGRTLDLDGSVVQCSQGRRRIERDRDGTVTAVVSTWEGGRFNSPNDVIVADDGAIWFSDPPYGIPTDDEGHASRSDYDGCYVFRVDPVTGVATPVITDMVHPNGLAFSPDGSLLYVSDTAAAAIPGGPSHIRVYDVAGAECLNGRVFAHVTQGVSDGLRVDVEGRLWSSSDGAVEVFDSAGTLRHRIPVPETVANVCFGGPEGADLFIAATSSLYRIRTTTRDAHARSEH